MNFNFWIPKKFKAVSLNSAFFGFYAHAGFLSGLDSIGFQPEVMVGCSSGAMVSALHACGVSSSEMEKLMLQLKRSDFWEGGPVRLFTKPLLQGLSRYSGILTGKKVRDLLFPYLGGKSIEHLPIKLGISVSNLSQSERQLLTKGSVLDAVMASMTFPLLFEIQKIGNEEFIDGGVADHEPIRELILDKSIEKIVVHQVENSREVSAKPILRMFSSAVGIIEKETRELKELLAKKYGKKIIRVVTKTPFINEKKLERGIQAMRIARNNAISQKGRILG